MTEVFAVDIALLLPGAVDRQCRELNGRLFERESTGFRFDDNRQPHITLAQGFVRTRDLETIREHLGRSLSGDSPIEVRAIGVHARRLAGPRGTKPPDTFHSVTHLVLEPSAGLQAMHERMAHVVAHFSGSEGDEASFFVNGETARDSDIAWVRGFRRNASFEKYDPHVTIGIGQLEADIEAYNFVVDHVGLFQLGRFCTCRQLLGEWRL